MPRAWRAFGDSVTRPAVSRVTRVVGPAVSADQNRRRRLSGADAVRPGVGRSARLGLDAEELLDLGPAEAAVTTERAVCRQPAGHRPTGHRLGVHAEQRCDLT